MNRFLIILIASFSVLIVIIVGAILFLLRGTAAPAAQPSTTPSSQQQGTQTTSSSSYTSSATNPDASSAQQAAVQAAYRSELAKHPSDNTQLHATVVVGDYALQVWAGDVMGGEALMHYDRPTGAWKLVDAGGGQWGVDGLLAAGVPQTVADDLLKGLGR